MNSPKRIDNTDDVKVYRLTRSLFWKFCRLLCRFYFPVTVSGRGNLPEGNFLICSNHSSHLDSVVLVFGSDKSLNDFAMLAAKDYFFNGGFKEFVVKLCMNLICISREPKPSELKGILKDCRQALQRKNTALIMYPEGTRSMTGEIQDFKRGPIWLAGKLGIPIVPAYLNGTFESMPKGRHWPKAHPITVRFGTPIVVIPDKTQNASQFIDRLAAQLAQAVDDLKTAHDSQRHDA